MVTGDEALGSARSTRELPLQEGKPNSLSLLFTQLLASVFKNPSSRNVQSMQFMKKGRCEGGTL